MAGVHVGLNDSFHKQVARGKETRPESYPKLVFGFLLEYKPSNSYTCTYVSTHTAAMVSSSKKCYLNAIHYLSHNQTLE